MVAAWYDVLSHAKRPAIAIPGAPYLFATAKGWTTSFPSMSTFPVERSTVPLGTVSVTPAAM